MIDNKILICRCRRWIYVASAVVSVESFLGELADGQWHGQSSASLNGARIAVKRLACQSPWADRCSRWTSGFRYAPSRSPANLHTMTLFSELPQVSQS